jgi:HPt (histidine-containing phosphotransfer) domain-containing protein
MTWKTHPLLDSEILNGFRELQGDDVSFMPKYFKALLKGTSQHFEELKQAVHLNDSVKFANSAHAIKSACTNVGAVPITELAAKAEKMGKAGTVMEAASFIPEIEALLIQLKTEILALPEMKDGI